MSREYVGQFQMWVTGHVWQPRALHDDMCHDTIQIPLIITLYA